MGKKPNPTSHENGTHYTGRFREIQVNVRWVEEAQRNLKELQRFRLMMLRLERADPSAYTLAKSIIRGIDMGEFLAHNRTTLDKLNNDITNS